jgi:hypothetical protein
MSQRRCTARAMAWGEHIHSADGLQPAVAEQDSQTGTGKHLRHFPCTRIKRREQPFKGAATQGQPHTSAQWYDAERSYCYAKIQPHGWWGSWQVPPGKSLAGGHPASEDVQFFQSRVVLQAAHCIIRFSGKISSSSMVVTQSQQHTDRGEGLFCPEYDADTSDTAFVLADLPPQLPRFCAA